MSVQQSYVAAASESECGAGCVAFIGKKRRYLPAIFKFRKRLAVLCLEMSFNRDTLPSGIGSSDMLKKFRIANHLKRYENLKLDAQSAVVGETVPASWRALRATTVTPAQAGAGCSRLMMAPARRTWLALRMRLERPSKFVFQVGILRICKGRRIPPTDMAIRSQENDIGTILVGGCQMLLPDRLILV